MVPLYGRGTGAKGWVRAKTVESGGNRAAKNTSSNPACILRKRGTCMEKLTKDDREVIVIHNRG